ncbi:DUF1254 domain-containing protein [uncultured Erythrobacter sp.]|uniref:DUF1254 domain-containing protein n=1 Tax=uncultured Erythrobacter sp. TaxID=263913 RepID=UPI002634A9BD|nr:DUF1254 domain-containing protein [uncultured Erythrobacter sp.]
MKGWIGPIAFAAVTGIAAHWATLSFAPGVIMDRTLLALKNRDVALHAFTTPQRITPETQAVVRTSPDLFYALCRYDLSEPESRLYVKIGRWPEYQSLSFFDAETNNFVTIRGEEEEDVWVVLATKDTPILGEGEYGNPRSPTTRGVVLIRRLAPTQELFDQALQAAEADECRLLTA